MRGRVTAGVLTGVLVGGFGGACLATPAVAAETGGARLMSSAVAGEWTGSAGVCSFRSSSVGEYWLKCSGGGYGGTYVALLAGAPAPTCWLLPAGSEGNLTPIGAAPFALAPEVPLDPVPTSTPTSKPTSKPTQTPSENPAETPSENPTESPSETSSETPSETPSTETVPVEQPVDVLKVCIQGYVNPATSAPASSVTLVPAPVQVLLSDPGRLPFWWELTEGQRRWATRAEERGSIDEGTLRTSPSRSPRIGQSIAFSAVGATASTIRMGDSQMRATFVRLEVHPGEPGREPTVCTGPGRELVAGDTERTGEDVCSFVYEETSGGRGTHAEDTFDVRATEFWRLEVSSDAGATWTEHRTVERPVEIGLRVTEVQTLVVP